LRVNVEVQACWEGLSTLRKEAFHAALGPGGERMEERVRVNVVNSSWVRGRMVNVSNRLSLPPWALFLTITS